jgi:putative ABC transport system ATP-binding protein
VLLLEQIFYTLSPGTPMERKLFQGLSLDLKQGEFCTLVGGNGAGKSSLFRLIQGDIHPDSGQILRPTGGISQVVQDPRAGTMEALTIEENMAFAYKRNQFRGFSLSSSAKRRDLFRDRLSQLGMGLENRLQDLVGALSGGQRQGLSLIMAFLTPSDLVLLDEITGALDPGAADRVVELAARLVEAEHKTCLMITHSLTQALGYGTRLLVLKDGGIEREYGGEEKKQLSPGELLSCL